ncbi:MAG TPA: ABC transporter substrate-binding protein [Candidatus Limnocylindria bacterium]|jgi:peptide/nickel transport system substrate-binding protein|nr:ABC transporter substrate-binding protein [Candidatus Limnocylindria bacterium]
MTAKQRTGRVLIAVFAATMLVATACTPGGPTASSAPTAAASATEKPQQGGRIIEGWISDLATIQPVLSNDTTSARAWGLIYDGIIQQDAKTGEPKPKMATYSISSDGLTYTFEMNAKANWSDGKPVIAQDWLTGLMGVGKSGKTVRKSTFQDIQGFNEFCAPAGTQCKATASSITGVTIDSANPKKWSVKMTKVSCPAILDLNGYTIPTQVFGKYLTATSKAEDFDNAPENTNPTVFSGPFKFKEWRKGDQAIFSKNETYWQGVPNVDEYVMKVVANTAAVTNGLKTGELTFGTVLARDLADMQTVDSVKITKYQNLGYTFIGWNTASPSATGLADKRVRQALAYGIDMDAVIKAVVFGEATKQVAHHVPVQWAYPSIALEPYKYDKAKAEQLLKDAGWTKGSDGILANAAGKKFSLTISTNSGNQERETLAQVAADQYKQLGIDAKARPEAFQGLVTKLTTGDQTLEATIIGWSLGGDPDPYSIWHSSNIPDPAKKVEGFGFTYFKDPAMDKAIEEGRNPTNGDCSTAARKKNYETFNKILNENQPYNFGYSNNTLAVSQKTLQNFNPASFSTLYNVHEWWVKK